ncbi:unnamed protein product [Leishmania donovani]|uniref:Uncharacterized protein n=1 Tax=Leishmania donovani TaxID=5661 RepID=E9BAY7_LEIDO|nr:uncharacterized protein LDBPK_120120 [Leishmania donovani]CBZ32412.1 unnamed protein product [Leishmania donovani]
MSSFSRSALDMLQAAEGALTQRRCYGSGVPGGASSFAYKTINTGSGGYATGQWYRDPNSSALSPVENVEELQQQLGRAMRELIELRAELAAERDRRHETLIAMGRQWKEDILVEVHRRGAALQSDVSAVEEKMMAQWKESNEGRLVMRRQLEEAMRAGKIRDTNQFQLREEVQETARHLEERVDMALAQSSAARADCSRQLEQERATLSERLDVELLRLVEMRRDDQRALQQARELMRDEGLRVRDDIRRVVQEVWETSASALVKTATEPIEQLRAELRETKAAAQAMEERVADCVRACQAECRTVTTTTTERLHALESKEAVAISSIDRAERKADSAYETARHMEATIAAAKDATERALVQVAGAAERTLKVEHALADRDSRLVAVEAQLHAITTAEGLRADVEACKRQAGRLESRVEAAGALCTRVEQLADRAAQQVASFADRIESCERSTQRSVGAVQRVQDGLEACESEGHQMRTRFETSEAVLQRHTHLLAQLEQQISGQENRLGLWRQQQEQHVKDQMTVQRELTERAEVTHTVASRAQQVSSDARAEVHRLERRIDDVDRRLTSTSAETTTLRGCIDSQHTQALEAQRQQQQLADELQSLASKVDERMAPVKELVRNSEERMKRAEAQAQGLGKKLAECEERLHEMGPRVLDHLKDAVRHHVGEALKRLFAAMNEGMSRVTERVAAVEEAADLSQQRVAEMPQQLTAMQQASAKLQRHVQSLEASLQSLSGQTQKLAVHADTQAGDRQRLGTVQQELMCLTAVQQRTQQDVRLLQEAMRVLQAMATVGSMRDFSLSELGTSQARTASTEMAPAADAISSSPSAHQPPSSGVRTSSHALVAGEHSQPPAQRAAAVAAPPLANTSGASLQELQDRQRASSGSRSSSSKEGSEERPALHLSGVSSVRPSNGQEERLHSLVEAGDVSTASADGDDTVEAFTVRPGAVARLPRTSAGTNGSASMPLFATTRTETVEQLSAPAHDSTQASAVGNVSHCTAIREFTTITSSSSLSDSDSSEDDRRRVQEREVPTRRGAPSEERTDDVSSDLTTAIMLTSEASTKQSNQRGSRPPPSSGQQRAAKMSTAWRQCSSGSSEEGTPVARRAAWGSAPPPQSQHLIGASESESESTLQGAGALDDSDDRVQAMPRHDSDTEEVERAVAAEEAVAGVARLQPTCTSQAAATTYFARSPGNPNWNDWDDDGEEDDDDEKRRGNIEEEDEALEPKPTRPYAAPHAASAASEDDTDDAVMHFKDAESSSCTPGPRETDATTPAAGLAATVMHRQQDAADDLRATPRRMFVSTSDDGRGVSTQLPDSVPRHGRGTTSSSSSSAERAEALGLRGARQSPPQRAATQMRQYTNFDDSTSSDDD